MNKLIHSNSNEIVYDYVSTYEPGHCKPWYRIAYQHSRKLEQQNYELFGHLTILGIQQQHAFA